MARTKTFDQEQVLEKAVQLFWEQGFANTSMQNLVDHLGINRASIYDTYGDKRMLFDQAFLKYRTENIIGLKHFFKTQDSPKSAFKKLFKRVVNNTNSTQQCKGCFIVNTTTEFALSDPKIKEILQQNSQDIQRIFYKYLKKSIEGEKGVLKNKAAYLYTFLSGLNVMGQTNDDPKVLDLIIEEGLKNIQ